MKHVACPCCGRAMKTGVLTRMNEVWWHPDGEKKTELKDFLSWKGIKQLCSDHMAGCIEILDAEEGWRLDGEGEALASEKNGVKYRFCRYVNDKPLAVF